MRLLPGDFITDNAPTCSSPLPISTLSFRLNLVCSRLSSLHRNIQVCSMGFKWKHALKNHMITHSNKKEHLCDVCGYATAHKSQLKAHRLVHSGDTFRCPHAACAFQATKRQNLKYHMLTHTREKPHQCEVCGQSFSLVKNMRRHMMLHQTEKPHRYGSRMFGCFRCQVFDYRQRSLLNVTYQYLMEYTTFTRGECLGFPVQLFKISHNCMI